MLCELILYCIYSLIMMLTSKHLDSVWATALSSLLACAVFFLPVLIYTKTASVSFSELLYPNGRHANDRTHSASNTLITFVFALAMTVSAVNVLSLATDAVFELLGAPLAKQSALKGAELITLFIRNVLVAAVFEELLLRGAVLNATRGMSDIKRVLISALFFALIHCNLRSFFYAFGAGAVIAYFTLKANSVIFGITLHFSQNCVTFLFVLLAQMLKKNTYALISAICFITLLTVAIAGAIFTVHHEQKRRLSAPAIRENDNSGLPACAELIAFTLAAALITAVTF